MGRYSKRVAQLAKARAMLARQIKVPHDICIDPLLQLPSPTPAAAGQSADDQSLQTNNVGEGPSLQSSSLAANHNANGDDALNKVDSDSELSLEESSCDDTDELSGESDSGSDIGDIVEAETAIDPSRSALCAYSMLQWKENAGSTLKRSYGSGSISTEKRRRKNQRDLGVASSGSLKITELFNRQRELQAPESRSEKQGLTITRPRSDRDHPQEDPENLKQRALKDLEMLLNSKREQIRKYGHLLAQEGDFCRRHCMVRNFLYMQKERSESGRLSIQSRQDMAEVVAITFNRRRHTGRRIITWERQWIESGRIPESKAGKHRARLSWLEDEGILCGIRDFAKSQGEGQISYRLGCKLIDIN